VRSHHREASGAERGGGYGPGVDRSTQQTSADALAALADRGLVAGAVLGAGMEGVVLALDDDQIAKVWHGRSRTELERLRTFTGALADAGLPFATPRVLDVISDGGVLVTVETRLHGRPMRPAVGAETPVTDAEATALVDVLTALSLVTPDLALSVLPVLSGEPAFTPDQPFTAHLADLVQRRVAHSVQVLRGAVPDALQVADRTVARLRTLGPRPTGLIHGDLIPANVFVDEAGRLTGVLDFGFFTTVGDPAFDAAITASVMDMYGPHARTTEARLDAAFAARFAHPPQLLSLYRAAYALTTSTEFSASGSDGHFAWCAHMLQRRDIREALLP